MEKLVQDRKDSTWKEQRPAEAGAKGKTVRLASKDFVLSLTEGRTNLTALAPVEGDAQVARKGDFRRWSEEDWNSFVETAKKFERPDLIRDLSGLKEALGGGTPREEPVFDDDAGEKPSAVHSLLVRYSRRKGYLRVRGTATYEHREELRSLGLRWNPSIREWEARISGKLLENVIRYVERNGTAHDPEKIGYERCGRCGRWKPEGRRCPRNVS